MTRRLGEICGLFDDSHWYPADMLSSIIDILILYLQLHCQHQEIQISFVQALEGLKLLMHMFYVLPKNTKSTLYGLWWEKNLCN